MPLGCLGEAASSSPARSAVIRSRVSVSAPAHWDHASVDAIATAELLVAQAAELGHRLGCEPTLADLSPIHRR